MTETNEKSKKSGGTLSLGGRGKLGLKKPLEADKMRQSFGQGRVKTVQVEVKRSRLATRQKLKEVAAADVAPEQAEKTPAAQTPAPAPEMMQSQAGGEKALHNLTNEERATRLRALEDAARQAEEERRQKAAELERLRAEAAARAAEEAKQAKAAAKAGEDKAEDQEVTERRAAERNADDLRQRELEELQRIEEEAKAAAEAEAKKLEAEAQKRREEEERRRKLAQPMPDPDAPTSGRADRFRRAASPKDNERDEAPRTAKKAHADFGGRRRSGKLTVTQALSGGAEGFRQRSAAAMRRQREKARMGGQSDMEKIKRVHEVVVPETITVQELASRMAEKGADVVKTLMKMGVMATITQSIDGDTAELVVEEMGHKLKKRVAESDIELGIEGIEDKPEEMQSRAPVVTVMGHVDHGKTSLLDAIRKTDVAEGEAGGITQHIGAYQVRLQSGGKITFIDTPGHAAFTEMRSRGAKTTDVVVLVVAANDSIMPQTIEAISHAKAAEVPIIVAINKCDLPDANPKKVRTDLLSHEVILEDVGGEVLAVEVSAKTGQGLEQLEETILLQAEMLDLKANPDRSAVGVVVEAKMEQGRGPVATILIQKGTLLPGEVFVVGSEWGKVRALVDDRGNMVESAGPSMPVEVLGLNGVPEAGDQLVVVESESRAREVAEYRERKKREAQAALRSKAGGSMEDIFQQIKDGEKKSLPVVIKGDVHGSVEAIAQSLQKLVEENDELDVRVLHTGVGGINDSDVQLARASGAILVGFNVRANPQAREMARRDGIEIRYYSVIYDIIDDVKALLSGMLSPEMRETYLGQAEIREVFNITKAGKIAGCMVTEGKMLRGAKVRLLRDDVVIHEGKLKQLKRFKDDVQEVAQGYECGMSFERYDDIREGDIIECFDVKEIARQL